MPLDPRLLEILACPEDKGPLLFFATEQVLYNPRLKRKYRVDNDVPQMLIEVCQRRSKQPAFTNMGKTLSYADIDRLSADRPA